MEVIIAKTFSNDTGHDLNYLLDFSNEVESYFKNLTFGDDVTAVNINLICVSKNYEPFFKPKKIKYLKNKTRFKIHGLTGELEKLIDYDVPLDFVRFKNSSTNENIQYVINEIVSSLRELDKLKGKIKHFEFEKFKVELDKFITNYLKRVLE